MLAALHWNPYTGELLGLRWEDVDLDHGALAVEHTINGPAGKLRMQDTKAEGSEAVLPLPEWTWFTLLEHQEAQAAERERLAEIWQEHGMAFPSELGTPMELSGPDLSIVPRGSGPGQDWWAR